MSLLSFWKIYKSHNLCHCEEGDSPTRQSSISRRLRRFARNDMFLVFKINRHAHAPAQTFGAFI